MIKLDEKDVSKIVAMAMENNKKCNTCEFEGMCFFAYRCLVNDYEFYLKEGTGKNPSRFLYVVHGNTHYESEWCVINIFGIYDNEEDAETAKDQKIQELYEENINDQDTYVNSMMDIEVFVDEIELGKPVKVMLGGHYTL